MRSCERERCCVVIKGRRTPGGSRMARHALVRISGVTRIHGSSERRLVARVTHGGYSCVLIVDMARGACSRQVLAGQREPRCLMIERRRAPGRSGVAPRTGRCKS
jgi:hypothetical protein